MRRSFVKWGLGSVLAICLFGLTACGSGGGSAGGSGGGTTAESKAPAEKETPQESGEKAAEVQDIVISHQPQNHGLPSYIADKEGLFAENGLNAKILMFVSGPSQNEALGANEWDVGVMGLPPAIAGGLAYDSKVIGFAADDIEACDYWVRPDSDIAQVSGAVEGYPDIMGNAETWKGKTILCPTATTAHFLLISTLEKLGLGEEDVSIIHMDVSQAFSAFKAGQGDMVALWDPQSDYAPAEGWVKVSSGKAAGEKIYNVIVASQKAIDEKPDAVLNWLRTYYQTAEAYADDLEGQAEYLYEMQIENGLQVDEEIVDIIVNERPMPTLAEQKELFAGEYGSREADIITEKVIDFFVSQGRYEPADKEQLIESHFLDDRFLKQLFAE